MKIFRICPAPGPIRAFRKLHRLKEKSFAEQILTLRAENYLLPGGWAATMEAQGFEVFETLYNDWQLQARWALEHGKEEVVFENNWQFKLLLDQVRAFRPDVIFVYAGGLFWVPRLHREQLRAACEGDVIVVGYWGDELPPNTTYTEYFGDLDFVFCSSSRYEQHCRAAGIPAAVVGNPFDDTIRFQAPAKKTKDFIFCGTTGFAYPDHIQRYEKLIELMKKSDLLIWASEPNLNGRKVREFVLDLLVYCPTGLLELLKIPLRTPRFARAVEVAMILKETGLRASAFFRAHGGAHPNAAYFDNAKPLRQLFPRRTKKPVLNSSDYYHLIAESKLVLNLHRDEDADVGNIRCFEVTGLGSCLVTDRGPELREFFDVDNDIVTFDTVDECVEKIKYLLDHPKEIERIAANGQRTTLARHTVRHRCHEIAEKLRELTTAPKFAERGRRRTVIATYDFEKHPVSYDFAFFLQAAEIYRKLSRVQDLVVNIVRPADMTNQPGVSQEADAIVGVHGREFRVFHICTQLAELMRTTAVVNLKDRSAALIDMTNQSFVPYPGPDVTHHSAYYRLINENPDLVSGLSASVEAHRFVKLWLDTFQRDRKLLCITLRQYRYDPQRNSNLAAWAAFLDQVDDSEFAVVVLPDTDHIVDFKWSALGKYACFEPACFDVDLRFALYETAYLNMFVNNGPGAASMLDKKIRYLMFKIVVPSVPHCTEEFLRWNGFEIGTTPKFATPFQKWVWANDDTGTLWSEFCQMRDRIESAESPESNMGVGAKRAAS